MEQPIELSEILFPKKLLMDPLPAVVLCLVCGLPACGKTTLIDAIERQYRSYCDWEVYPLVFDRMFPHHHNTGKGNSNDGDNEDFDPAVWKRNQNNFFEEACRCLRRQHRRRLIIVEDNFYFRSMRRRYVHAVSEIATVTSIVMINVQNETSEVSLDRLRRRNSEILSSSSTTGFCKTAVYVPESSFLSIESKYEAPSQARDGCPVLDVLITDDVDEKEGEHVVRWIDSIVQKVIIDGELLTPFEAKRAAAQTEEHMIDERRSAQTETSHSVLHNVDLALRKAISKAMTVKTTETSRKERVYEYHKKKCAVLRTVARCFPHETCDAELLKRWCDEAVDMFFGAQE